MSADFLAEKSDAYRAGWSARFSEAKVEPPGTLSQAREDWLAGWADADEGIQHFDESVTAPV